MEVSFSGLNYSPIEWHLFTVNLQEDPCLTDVYIIDLNALGSLEFTYTLGDTALEIDIDDGWVMTTDSSCDFDLYLETSTGGAVYSPVFTFDTSEPLVRVYNDGSSALPYTHNLRLRASYDGKVSGDGILYFDVIIERSCYDKEVTIDANFMDSTYHTFEIGRDSLKMISYEKSAVKFDGDADVCDARIDFQVSEASAPTVWYTGDKQECDTILSEGDLSYFARYWCGSLPSINVYTEDPANQGSYTVVILAYDVGGSATQGEFQFQVDLTVSDCLTTAFTIGSSIVENPIDKIYDSNSQTYIIDSSQISHSGTSCPSYSLQIKEEGGTTLDPIFYFDDGQAEFIVYQQTDSSLIGEYNLAIEVSFTGLAFSPVTTYTFEVNLQEDPCLTDIYTIDGNALS